jgi:hypothetical protein
MNNEQLYTNLEDSKLLAETGLMAGVEPDGYLHHRTLVTVREGRLLENTINALPKAYRLDKLLMRLPDWVYSGKLPLSMSNDIASINIGEDVYYGYQDIYKLRGQPAIQATVKLLVLLQENGLLEEEKKEHNDKQMDN